MSEYMAGLFDTPDSKPCIFCTVIVTQNVYLQLEINRKTARKGKQNEERKGSGYQSLEGM